MSLFPEQKPGETQQDFKLPIDTVSEKGNVYFSSSSIFPNESPPLDEAGSLQKETHPPRKQEVVHY